MAKAKKLPSGQWRTLVYSHTDDHGKRKYESFTADTKKESEYMAAEFALNKNNRKKNSTYEDLTFGEALNDYISKRESVLSPRSIVDYKRIRRNSIQEIMNIKLCDITQEIIQEVVNNDSKLHAPKTVRNNHGLISAVLKQYKPEMALNTALPKKIRPDLYIPSDDEIRTVLEYAKDSDIELPILLAAFGPMRRGEICALESSDISGNVVHVRQNMVSGENGTWIIKQPKSYSGDRYIEYPDYVAAKWKGIDGRVTTLSPNSITDKFSRLLKRAGITHFRFHDLRHYCASIQHAIGIPDVYIMQRGGWGSDGVLKSVYRHAMNDKAAEMNQIANKHFEGLCNTKCNIKTKKP